jgi:hypothetical protein
LLRNITRSAQRGAELNAQLLGFARKETLLPKAVDLNHVPTGMSNLLQATVGDLIRIETRTQRDIGRRWSIPIRSHSLSSTWLSTPVRRCRVAER